MNNKILCWLAALIIGVSVVGLATSMPVAHARSDNPTLDGTSAISPLSANCPVSTSTLSCAAAVGLNTTQANDIVVLALYADGMAVSEIIDKAGLNFAPRFGRAGSLIAEYYAIAHSVLAADNTTVVFSGTHHALTFAATFAVAGANTRHTFDDSAGLPTNSICSGFPVPPSCDLNIPTKLANEFVFAITAIGNAPNCRTGFTDIFSNGWLEVDYTVPTTRGIVTFSCSRIDGSEPAEVVGDAIFPHPSHSPPTS